MDKRRFRKSEPITDQKPARYPTLSEFDPGRRDVLRRIGAAVLGLGSLGAILSACGDRSVGLEPDSGIQAPQGAAPMPDSRVDQPRPWLNDLSGAAPAPDSRVDTRPEPDATSDGEPDWGMAGVPRMPDAEIEKPSDGGSGQD